MAKIVRFEDLEVWRKGRELTKRIYSCSKQKGFGRDFALSDQIRRACISITSNIAEGFEAQSNAEFVKFLNYARRSASEVKSQLYLALDQEYVSNREFAELFGLSSDISKMLYGFIKYLKGSR
ncbi:MAG: four helix bundle protein [Bacteroidota bacterium]